MSNPFEAPTPAPSNSEDSFAAPLLNVPQAANAIAHFFVQQRYRLEAGTASDAVYGIGNDYLRILFGAFVKRYKFKIQVIPEGTGSRVYVTKGMSGAMGGAIGYSKMKKEHKRIREALELELNR